MLNFGASLQQAAVSHLGMPGPPRLATSERPAGREPEPLTASRARGPGLQRSRGGVGRVPACRRGSGEGVCVARGSGEAAGDGAPRERDRSAQGVMSGRGSSPERLEASEGEDGGRGRKSGEARGPPCTWRPERCLLLDRDCEPGREGAARERLGGALRTGAGTLSRGSERRRAAGDGSADLRGRGGRVPGEDAGEWHAGRRAPRRGDGKFAPRRRPGTPHLILGGGRWPPSPSPLEGAGSRRGEGRGGEGGKQDPAAVGGAGGGRGRGGPRV